jgi:hypothetical protein
MPIICSPAGVAKPKTPSHHMDLSSLLYPEKALRFLLPVPDESETDPDKIEVALMERIKELNCMYAMAILAEHYSDSIEDFLRNLVNILPHPGSTLRLPVRGLPLMDQRIKAKHSRPRNGVNPLGFSYTMSPWVKLKCSILRRGRLKMRGFC